MREGDEVAAVGPLLDADRRDARAAPSAMRLSIDSDRRVSLSLVVSTLPAAVAKVVE
jgi:hypothetical protein